MNFKRFLSIALATLILSSAALVSCSKEDPNADFDPDSPGDDFSGSISKEDENKKDEETAPVDEGDETKTYYISNADELLAVKRKGTYILTADIDMTGKEWTPVGTYAAPFVGTFDGAGYTIKGLTVTKDTKAEGECISYTYTFAGLIGCADGATIKNVTLEDVNISVTSNEKNQVIYAGAIAARTKNTTVYNCDVISGSVTSSCVFFKAYSAGIVAFSFESDIKLCNVNADISVTTSGVSSIAGGITGITAQNTAVNGCSVTGTVDSYSTDGNAYAGGISGYYNNSSLSHCSVNATVKAETKCAESETGKAGASYAGGAIGYCSNTLTTNQNVSVVSSQGTVTSVSADYVSYAGGICGYMAYTTLTDGYSSATVIAESDTREAFTGGIIGYLSTKTSVKGVFFAGSLSVSTTKDMARTGVIVAFDATAKTENKATIEDTAYLELSALSVTINGKKYTEGNKLPEKETFTSHGDSYNASSLKSKNILTSDLGWTLGDWGFTISDYPTVNLEAADYDLPQEMN